MKNLLTLMAVLEAATGLGLVGLPTLLVRLLLGSSLDGPVALTVARVAGVALLAMGVACWLARRDGRSTSARGLAGAMMLYNAAAAAVLAYAGIGLGLSSIGLWPVILLHAAVGVWCGVCLLAPRRSAPVE